jgi:hypothetical protein
LSGSFSGGDTVKLENLASEDWTQPFCEQWIGDITSGNGVVLDDAQVTDVCGSLLTSPQTLLQQVSNPNISYVSNNGSVRIGTATVFNASPALKAIAAVTLGVDPGDIPDVVQFSELVKVTYKNKTSIYYCSDDGSITQTGQWANDTSCRYNQAPDLAKQFCSHSGNCEIQIGTMAVPALSLFGVLASGLGLLLAGSWRLRARP